ncbi:NAD(P)/FAD-dependent oxidoreductase [Neobacillus mesonae]|nr:NAD(P)/FAD-dependent oxidoreductase [Neobacillus mesonae]
MLDCIIIGGGPAGLSAGLVLGRSLRKVVIFDHGKPRHASTRLSHGFLTRDGTSPSDFRKTAHEELSKYPSVHIIPEEVVDVQPGYEGFVVRTRNGREVVARKLLLCTGLREDIPRVPGLREFYGQSIFSCPYCDGYELRDKKLVLITEAANVFTTAQIIFHWSRSLVVCTNGRQIIEPEQKRKLAGKGIAIVEHPIHYVSGSGGQLRQIHFQNGRALEIDGGFVTPQLSQGSLLGPRLGCHFNDKGAFVTDPYGRTNIRGVYAAGDNTVTAPTQLIIAAAEGSKAAIGINMDLIHADFA